MAEDGNAYACMFRYKIAGIRIKNKRRIEI